MRLSWLRLFWVGVLIVGAFVGYAVSSGLGERLLHQEIETQLSRLLVGPVDVGEVQFHLRDGFRVEAWDLQAYPSPDSEEPPALRAAHATARVDPFALLIGQLELSSLKLDSPHLRLVPTADGRFRGLPLDPIDVDGLGGGEGGPALSAEAVAEQFDQLDETASALFETLCIAQHIEIEDGTVHWAGQDASGSPADYRFELVHLVIDYDWLSDAATLDWRAVFVDGRHAPFPFEALVERDEEDAFTWAIHLDEIPLAAAETPLAFIEGIEGLGGRLTADLRIDRSEGGHKEISLEGKIEDGVVGLRRSKNSLQRGEIDLAAQIRVHADRVELRKAHLEDDKLGLDIAATMARPLRDASSTYLESRMVGFELEDVFALVESLETDSDTTRGLTRLVERVQGGHILSVAASGRAPWREWRRLIANESNALPEGLRFGAAFEDVRVATGPGDRIEDLRGQVEWADDRMTLRGATASFRGARLPQLHLVLNGTQALANIDPDIAQITTRPPEIPGLGALIDIFEPENPDSLPPVKAIGLAIDHLEHPVFRWPLHDLRLLIEPLRRGVELKIQDGSWGGVGIAGEMVWFADPQGSTLSAEINLGEGRPPKNPISVAKKNAVDPMKARWAKGRFELEFRPKPRLPFQTATGFFRLDGTRLIGNDVDFIVEPTGKLASRMILDLKTEGEVGADISFASTDGRFEHLSEFLALPPGLARGEFGSTGTLRGPIRADAALIRELDGSVRVEARNGKIRTDIPLFLRLSRATEGFNPAAKDDELNYETMNATILFERGALSADDFKIEGPLRVFARWRIDPFAGPADIDGLVGIFLFRAPNQFLENLPLVKYFLPGSERGLFGAYFRVEGALAEPDVDALPMATIMSGVPAAIKAPFKVLQYLIELEDDSP